MGDYGKVDKDQHRKGYGMLGTDSILNEHQAVFSTQTAAVAKKGAAATNQSKKAEAIATDEVLQLDESQKQAILSQLQQGSSIQCISETFKLSINAVQLLYSQIGKRKVKLRKKSNKEDEEQSGQ